MALWLLRRCAHDLPKVVHEDSQLVTSELIAAYEAMTGKTLYPAQVERLLIDLIAYRKP
jgi:hypothetical protein